MCRCFLSLKSAVRARETSTEVETAHLKKLRIRHGVQVIETDLCIIMEYKK